MNDFENYLAIEDIGGPNFHPNKNSLVFTYNSPGVYHIYEIDIRQEQNSWATRLTYDENRCTSGKYLSDGSIVFTTDNDGDENFQIGVIVKGKQSIVSNDPAAKYRLQIQSKNYLFYSSNTEDKSKFCVYRHKLPLLENVPEKIYTPEKGTVAVAAIDDDESQIIIQNSLSNIHSELILLDMTSLISKNLTQELSPSLWQPVQFMGSSLLVLSNYASDFNRPGILDLESGNFASINIFDHMKVEFEDYARCKQIEDVFFLVNKEGYSEVFEFNPKNPTQFRALALPGKGVISSGDQRSYTNAMTLNHDGSLLAFNFSTSTSPPNIFVINLTNDRGWKATNSATPGITRSSFVNVSLHSYISFDELNVPYFKYIPKTVMPSTGYPTIIMIHGGPESQYRPSFSPIVQFYVSAGFAVIAPNIRGSAGYGRSYMDLDNKEKRLNSILDIKHLALHLQSSDHEIDGDKLVIYGGSYGGFAVLSAMTEHPELWKAGVDIVGISDFVTFLQNTAEWRRKIREAEYGSLDEDFEMLQAISPIHKIDKITAPLFIIQGDKDERVPLTESLQMYTQLEERGHEVELLRFADEGHGIAKLKNKIVAYPRVVNWLHRIVT